MPGGDFGVHVGGKVGVGPAVRAGVDEDMGVLVTNGVSVGLRVHVGAGVQVGGTVGVGDGKLSNATGLGSDLGPKGDRDGEINNSRQNTITSPVSTSVAIVNLFNFLSRASADSFVDISHTIVNPDSPLARRSGPVPYPRCVLIVPFFWTMRTVSYGTL